MDFLYFNIERLNHLQFSVITILRFVLNISFKGMIFQGNDIRTIERICEVSRLW